MPTTTLIDLEHVTHETIGVFCESCTERISWIECPTGGWWKHFEHPSDGHDASPDTIDLCTQIYILQSEVRGLEEELTDLAYSYGA